LLLRRSGCPVFCLRQAAAVKSKKKTKKNRKQKTDRSNSKKKKEDVLSPWKRCHIEFKTRVSYHRPQTTNHAKRQAAADHRYVETDLCGNTPSLCAVCCVWSGPGRTSHVTQQAPDTTLSIIQHPGCVGNHTPHTRHKPQASWRQGAGRNENVPRDVWPSWEVGGGSIPAAILAAARPSECTK
jgi:hypothetical protein